MGDTTISWLFRPGTRPRSWNPTQGCEMVSPGCKNCYAMRMAARFARDGWSKGLIDLTTGKWSREGRLAEHKLAEPLSWREPSTVFVNSMSDLFWENFTNEQIAAVFGIMAACKRHTFIIATKRAKRMRSWFQWTDDSIESHAAEWAGRDCSVSIDDARARERGLLIADSAAVLLAHGSDEPDIGAWLLRMGDLYAEAWGDPRNSEWLVPWPLPNVWLLVSVENQEMADGRIPDLLATPAAVHGLSCEPLLSHLWIERWLGACNCLVEAMEGVGMHAVSCPATMSTRVKWVIAGCESGPVEDVRPAQTNWFRSLREQCKEAGVAYFLKQANVKMEGITAGSSVDIKPGGVAEPPELDSVLHQEWPG